MTWEDVTMRIASVNGRTVTLESDLEEDYRTGSAHMTVIWEYPDDAGPIMDQVGDQVLMKIENP